MTDTDHAGMRQRAEQFRQCVRQRNRAEYAAAGIVALIFAAMALGLFGGRADPTADVVVRLGAAAMVLGMAFIAWQVRRRASADADTRTADPLSAHVRTLHRQRAAVGSVWRWYLPALLPGFLLLYAGYFLDAPEAWPWFAIGLAVTLAFIAALGALNARAARALDGELRRLEEERGA